jgi:hypothetical protein
LDPTLEYEIGYRDLDESDTLSYLRTLSSPDYLHLACSNGALPELIQDHVRDHLELDDGRDVTALCRLFACMRTQASPAYLKWMREGFVNFLKRMPHLTLHGTPMGFRVEGFVSGLTMYSWDGFSRKLFFKKEEADTFMNSAWQSIEPRAYSSMDIAVYSQEDADAMFNIVEEFEKSFARRTG